MATLRYGLKVEANNVWAVVDVFTGQPVVLHGSLLSNLPRDEADEFWIFSISKTAYAGAR